MIEKKKHNTKQNRLYDQNGGSDSCGVGFITCKDSVPSHELIVRGNEALCVVPHRGGMDAQGVGDGGGVLVDLSEKFFSKVAGEKLSLGSFGVGAFFMPSNDEHKNTAIKYIEEQLKQFNLEIIKWRTADVDKSIINEAAQLRNPDIHQVIFKLSNNDNRSWNEFENNLITVVENINNNFFVDENYEEFYPISVSSKTTVYKGCLLSNEVVPYFKDLMDTDFEAKIFLFHTRYSTNTAPRPTMAQPFSRMAHNGELNTDKKNRIHEDSVLRAQGKKLITPIGQSDSARLDQTLARRLRDNNLNVVQAFTRMAPPAWENAPNIIGAERAMLEYFALDEEKVDGPAALIFTDGRRIGAKLDRLGLRPLRMIETDKYISVMSEAGQNVFKPSEVISRSRISAGDMVVYDHKEKHLYEAEEILSILAKEQDYESLLEKSIIRFDELDKSEDIKTPSFPETTNGRMVAYNQNIESFRFLLDPILENGAERVSAMGYGLAINPLSTSEGGISRYFSQRFAQVTNPPLDSIREVDGMSPLVILGAKPSFCNKTKQIRLESPIVSVYELATLRKQNHIAIDEISAVFTPDADDNKNADNLEKALEKIADEAVKFAPNNGIIIVSDTSLSKTSAPIPMLMAIAKINNRLIKEGLRFNTSLIAETGQAISSHDTAVILGFGASAVTSTVVYERAKELFPDDVKGALKRYLKGCEKALLKTMGKFGLCTVESYVGGEFFEGNFIDTKNDKRLKELFPNVNSPVGGVGFVQMAKSARDWFNMGCENPAEIPSLGLFKEKSDGAGHSFGVNATKEFIDIATGEIKYAQNATKIPFGTWLLDDHMTMAKEVLSVQEKGSNTQYLDFGYELLSDDTINNFVQTADYDKFTKNLMIERANRPSALRDLFAFPLDLTNCKTKEDFINQLKAYDWNATNHATIAGMPTGDVLDIFKDAVKEVLGEKADEFIANIKQANKPIDINKVQNASEITKTFASGAMSFGALNRNAHEAVALGTNLVGGNSNCGEGGEHYSRYNTPKSSSVKQIASGRFGVWAGYFADPNLREIEIKLAQGAKPGEGGQLPAKKVTIEIASMRGGTPMVELVSPPPHHDTYSIEDLAQLIHDAHCARVKVIVKLVSSEGIGTIAVGVAKAGADVINIAGSTGGTGAAQVTSLKNAGRVAELGIVEVHQALCDTGLRDKVILRNSGALQNGYDVIKSAIFGADSFEFGTTALMMIGCVMAKNCNVKCPAGLTTDPEIFAGDGRALAQYFINLAIEVREILAYLGYESLEEIRGKMELLHLIDHPDLDGRLDLTDMLVDVEAVKPKNPKYLEASYTADDNIIDDIKQAIIDGKKSTFDYGKLNNCNKSVGGQTAIDIERMLSWEIDKYSDVVDTSGYRPVLKDETITITSHENAGQSYGAFTTTGMKLIHTGLCNDGVGKSMCGGKVVVLSPGISPDTGAANEKHNVLVGNFALFGATGGKLFVGGGGGDRFAVRNTGALAVVEGVGDFACEYMVNGTFLNLGEFGKGFGNGMSGGNAYQYDPSGALEKMYSHDSVVISRLHEQTEETYHTAIVKNILQQHLNETKSETAKAILDNWENEIKNFWVVNPIAIYETQSPSHLVKLGAKAIEEELLKGVVKSAFESIKVAYKSDTQVMDGKSPNDNSSASQLLIKFGIMALAKQKAESELKKMNIPLDEYMVNVTAKKLIITEDKDVMGKTINAMKNAVSSETEETLSVWLSQKRINDYQASISGRDTKEIYSDGMFEWMKHITNKNNEYVQSHKSIEQVIQNNFIISLAQIIPLDTMAVANEDILQGIQNG
ncbi:MAG: glutamate synthase-related protein [Alphaproteobacteria bacterium]